MKFIIARKGHGYISDKSKPLEHNKFEYTDRFTMAKFFDSLKEAADYLTLNYHLVFDSEQFQVVYLTAEIIKHYQDAE